MSPTLSFSPLKQAHIRPIRTNTPTNKQQKKIKRKVYNKTPLLDKEPGRSEGRRNPRPPARSDKTTKRTLSPDVKSLR